MIFSDKNTAHTIRQQAKKELEDWLFTAMKKLQDHCGKNNYLTDDGIRNYAQSVAFYDMPPLLQTLLWKSGIIHQSNDDGETYPVVLFYDDDGDYTISKAMTENRDRLIGGLHKGHIHT